ncbi:MAG: hypothetical protein WC455_19050 [Dehalococcoidia bacterium]|jgi:hypothetical protein
MDEQHKVIKINYGVEGVYEIIPLSECSNSVMYIGGKQIVLAYTGRWQKPAGTGWVGRADIDWSRNEIGMVWSREV